MGNSAPNIQTYSVNTQNYDKRPNETNIFRNPYGLTKNLQEIPNVTIQDLFKQRFTPEKLQHYQLGYRPKKEDGTLHEYYVWYTNNEIQEFATCFGSALLHFNLSPELREYRNMALRFIGVYSKNNIEVFVAEIACILFGITSVPIYDTLGEMATNFAFDQTKMSTCLISAAHVDGLSNNKLNQGLQTLETLIIIDPENLKEETKIKASKLFKLVNYSELIFQGQQNLQNWVTTTPQTIQSFSYTSGTTGEPKGAMISNQNIIALIEGIFETIDLNESDVHLSYLPTAHILEKSIFLAAFSRGIKIGMYNGDVLKLKEDLAILKPTCFVSVPRLYNKFYDVIQTKIKETTGFSKTIANKAIRKKLANLKYNGDYTHSMYDMIVFKKMKQVLGGRVKWMITGSAPIAPEVIEFMKIAFCCPMYEAYGQTEATGAEFITQHNDGVSGHVGGPLINLEFKLVDIPELNYFSTDVDEFGNPSPRGELWVRGPAVIPGYYKNEVKTAESLTQDQWLMSGDVAQILPPLNRVKIIDRKKNIFKLSQGEYIAPEKLENTYKTASPFIEAVFVYGDSMKSSLIAIVNIEGQNLVKFGQQIGINGTIDELKNNDSIKKAIIQMFDELNKQNKYNSLEKIRKIYIETTLFTNLELLTTTMKIKRNETKKYYSLIIDDLYRGSDQTKFIIQYLYLKLILNYRQIIYQQEIKNSNKFKINQIILYFQYQYIYFENNHFIFDLLLEVQIIRFKKRMSFI